MMLSMQAPHCGKTLEEPTYRLATRARGNKTPDEINARQADRKANDAAAETPLTNAQLQLKLNQDAQKLARKLASVAGSGSKATVQIKLDRADAASRGLAQLGATAIAANGSNANPDVFTSITQSSQQAMQFGLPITMPGGVASAEAGRHNGHPSKNKGAGNEAVASSLVLPSFPGLNLNTDFNEEWQEALDELLQSASSLTANSPVQSKAEALKPRFSINA